MRWSTRVACAAVLLAASLAGQFVSAAAAQEAVYLVRHAERVDDERDSPISATGQARAARLADILRDAGITDIFVSEYQRTAQTAAPLAARLGITPQVVRADNLGGLVMKVRAAGPKARVLIAGHSDTVPALIAALGCTTPVTIAMMGYDNLFIVVPIDKAPPRLLRLRY